MKGSRTIRSGSDDRVHHSAQMPLGGWGGRNDSKDLTREVGGGGGRREKSRQFFFGKRAARTTTTMSLLAWHSL